MESVGQIIGYELGDEEFAYDPSLALYLPLHELDGAQFRSRDAYGHLCTNVGTLWRPDGRYFDGVDDEVTLPTTSLLQMGTGDWSAIVWYKPLTLPSQYPCPIVFDNDGIGFATGSRPGLLQDGDIVRGTVSSLTVGNWSQIGVTRTGSIYRCYFNGRDDTATLTNAGWGLAGIYRLGKGYSNQVVNGTLGEVYVYKRVLTAGEIAQIYFATRWRYGV